MLVEGGVLRPEQQSAYRFFTSGRNFKTHENLGHLINRHRYEYSACTEYSLNSFELWMGCKFSLASSFIQYTFIQHFPCAQLCPGPLEIFENKQRAPSSCSLHSRRGRQTMNRRQKKTVNSVLKGGKSYGIKKMQSRAGRIRGRERGWLQLSPLLWRCLPLPRQ